MEKAVRETRSNGTNRDRVESLPPVMRAMGIGWMDLDPQGAIQDADELCAEIFGMSNKELRTTKLQELAAPKGAEELIRQYKAFLAGNGTWRTLSRFLSAEGDRRDLELLGDEHWKTSEGARLFLRDATDGEIGREEAEEIKAKLQQAERSGTIGKLAGGVAHDFNNQLHGIVTCSSILQSLLKDKPQLKEFAVQIRQAAKNATTLTSQLLDFTRLEIKPDGPMDLTETVLAVENLLAHGLDKRIEVRCGIQIAPAWVWGNPQSVQQLLLRTGLLMSATMDSSQKCTLELEVSYHEKNPGRDFGYTVSVKGLPSASLLPAGDLDDLRNQAHVEEVTQQPGEVRYFWKGQGLRPAECALPKGLSLLMMEPDALVRTSMQEFFAREGITATGVENAEAVLQLLKLEGSRYVAVIMDMEPPDRTGDWLHQEIRKLFPHLPVLLTSGHRPGIVGSEAIASGADAFFQKPYEPVTLLRALGTIVGHDTRGR